MLPVAIPDADRTPGAQDPVTLYQRLQDALTAAMRSRDELRRDTLRMAIAAVYNDQKAARRELRDDEVVSVLARELKRRRESIDAFRSAGREDRAQREEAEAAVISEYMPARLSDAELAAMVREAVREAAAESPRDMGRVMGLLVPRTRGRADGRAVSELVNRELAGVAARMETEAGGRESGAER
jgi:uncharacterized protein YqeY